MQPHSLKALPQLTKLQVVDSIRWLQPGIVNMHQVNHTVCCMLSCASRGLPATRPVHTAEGRCANMHGSHAWPCWGAKLLSSTAACTVPL